MDTVVLKKTSDTFLAEEGHVSPIVAAVHKVLDRVSWAGAYSVVKVVAVVNYQSRVVAAVDAEVHPAHSAYRVVDVH